MVDCLHLRFVLVCVAMFVVVVLQFVWIVCCRLGGFVWLVLQVIACAGCC